MSKSGKSKVKQRVQEITQLVLAGAEYPDLRQYASEKAWGVSDRQVHRYLEAAYKGITASIKRDRDDLVARHLMQRRALYARCMKAGDYRTALQVLKDEAELQGLYPPTKIAPTTPDGQGPYVGVNLLSIRLETATMEELDMLQALIDRIDQRAIAAPEPEAPPGDVAPPNKEPAQSVTLSPFLADDEETAQPLILPPYLPRG